jgi:hypothetical protein
MLNGDTTGTHQDSDTTSFQRCPESLEGLRKLALAVAANGASLDLSTFTTANLRLAAEGWQVRHQDGQSGLDRLDCGLLQDAGPDRSFDPSELRPAGDRSDRANWASSIAIPIIVSEYQRQDLNASGVYDNVTTTKTAFQYVNLDQYMIGNRRGQTMTTDNRLYLETDQVVTVATQRVIFVDMLGGTSATNSSVAVPVSTSNSYPGTRYG